MTTVKLVKLNQKLKQDKMTKPNKKLKYSIYKNLLENPERIKNYIEKKSRKNNDARFKAQFTPFLKKTKKNIRSKIKYKSLNRNMINKIFYKINNEQQINSVNKENILKLFREIISTNNISLSNKFIKIITRKQIIMILAFLGVVRTKTQAPTPLLKNLLYNCITSTINIIV